MKYYQFNLGDYASHTKHLSLLEDLAYRRMLDLYYTHEEALPLDVQIICRLIGMREHIDEVTVVLNEFFLKGEDGWVNKGAEKVLESFRKVSEGGKKGANARWNNSDKDAPPIAPLMPPPSNPYKGSGDTPNANHKPITINQEPITINQEERVVAVAPKNSTKKLPDEEWLSEIRANYSHVNLDVELGKIDAWLSVNPGRQKTRKFVLNWLNRIDAPLGKTEVEEAPFPYQMLN